jgi:alpha-galactosidase
LAKTLQNKEEAQWIPTPSKSTDDNSGICNAVYTPSGSWSMFEPAISITHADGNISTELLFQSVQEQKRKIMSLTTILLKDPVYQTEVKLFHKHISKKM